MCKSLVSLLLAGLVAGLSMEIAAQEVPGLDEVTLLDLSHAYDDSTLFWPTSPIDFEHNELAYGPSGNGYFYSAYTFATPEHGGTHLDAPIHFAQNGKTVGQLDINDLFAPVVVIDVTARAALDRDYRLTPADISAFETTYGDIDPGTAVLVRTDWSDYWPDADAYLGDDTPGDASNLSFPGVSEEAAQVLVEKGVAMVGIDTASIDYGKTANFPVHVVFAANAVPALENLANLASLPITGAWLLAAPMKIGEGSGAPARVIAFVRK